MLQTFPGFSDEVSGLLNQIKPTLPVLLANLGTVGEILMTYNASLEQLLVLLPPYFAQQQSYTPLSDSTGMRARGLRGDGQRSARVYGRLPAAVAMAFAGRRVGHRHPGRAVLQAAAGFSDLRSWRPQLSLHQEARQASTHGRRSATATSTFEPLAMRQHALGPAPFDPSLIAQGIPIDDRADLERQPLRAAGGNAAAARGRSLGYASQCCSGRRATCLAAGGAVGDGPATATAEGNSLNGQPIPPVGPPPGPAPVARR